MKTNLIVTLAMLITASTGCNRDSKVSTPVSSEPQRRVEAEPFHGEIYRSMDGKITLTIVSRDELELREDGPTLLCKYTKQADGLRVIVTALGTTQVVYYRFTDQGIQDNRGLVLLSAERYAAAMEQIRLQHQQEQRERQRVSEVIANSKRQTQEFTTIQLVSHTTGRASTPDQLILTDVSVKMHHPSGTSFPDSWQATNTVLYFADIKRIGELDTDVFVHPNSFNLYETEIDKTELTTISEADADRVRSAILGAFNAWKSKFPEAVSKVK